jgi:ribosomal protein S18 acetylase RimI-like enzyme
MERGVGEMSEVPLEAVVIKPLRKDEEADRLVPIYLDAFHGMRDPESIAEWLRCNMRAYPQKLCFGAWHNDCLLGYVIWTEKGGFRAEALWELEQIAVLSKYRRQGIGAKLIRNSLADIKTQIAKQRGARLKLVVVTTGVHNESRKLYEKVLGARLEGTIKDFYEGDEQMLIARFKSPPGSISTDEFLKREYEACLQGYNNRDTLVPMEMGSILLIFTAVGGVLAFLSQREWSQPPLLAAAITLGIFGFLAISTLHIDMASNISCKQALRENGRN